MEAHPDQSFWNSVASGTLLGNGGTAFVFLHDGAAVKIPMHFNDVSSSLLEEDIEAIQSEQSLYQRLHNCWGVVPYLQGTESTITLAYMENGDLRKYLDNHCPPRSLQLLWMRDIARALKEIHERRVLVEDIASRNLLLDSDLSVKFCDFATSSELPLDTDMKLANVQGCSVQTELGLVGAIIYEIVTRNQIKFDLWEDINKDPCVARLPTRTNLPSTEGVWLGSIIEKCWIGAFLDARELLDELESVNLDEKPAHRTAPGQPSSAAVRPCAPFVFTNTLSFDTLQHWAETTPRLSTRSAISADYAGRGKLDDEAFLEKASPLLTDSGRSFKGTRLVRRR